MACCMFAAFIVGHIILMSRTIIARWSPACAAAQAAKLGAAAWRPGLEVPAATAQAGVRRQLWMARPVGAMLVVVSLSYFAVQAKDALEQASDPRSFAILLTQNICRVKPNAAPKAPVQIAASQQNAQP